jgi:hypothetical protein
MTISRHARADFSNVGSSAPVATDQKAGSAVRARQPQAICDHETAVTAAYVADSHPRQLISGAGGLLAELRDTDSTAKRPKPPQPHRRGAASPAIRQPMRVYQVPGA